MFAIMERSDWPLWADMAGGLAMLDFVTEANEFGYCKVQYAIKFAETCNNLFIASAKIIRDPGQHDTATFRETELDEHDVPATVLQAH